MTSAKRIFPVVICWLAILGPVAIGVSRDSTVRLLSHTLGISELTPVKVSERQCEGELCTLRYRTAISAREWDAIKVPAIGYYGAQLDSYIVLNGQALDPISALSQLRFTWPRFRVASFAGVHIDGDAEIQLVTVSPRSSKKIGMDTGRIFIGEKKKLETVQFVFSLFNIHLYLLMALLVVALTTTIALSSAEENQSQLSQALIRGALAAITLVAFTKIFDDLLFALGAPQGLVENLPRYFWAPVLFVHVAPKSKHRSIATVAWLVWVIAASFEWSYKDFFLYTTYRWAVAASTVYAVFWVLKSDTKARVIPYLALVLADAVAVHGLLPVKSAMYLSPLGVGGLFFSAHLSIFIRILEHHRFWYERRQLIRHLQAIRESGSVDKKEWLELLHEVCSALSRSTAASKVSLCYLGFDSPLILTLRNGTVQKYEDGQLPPIFARVIQTREALWWKTESDLAAYLPNTSIRRRDVYNSDRAVIVPILVGGEAYGAIALTDFEDLRSILDSEDKKHHVESTIISFLDLISAQVVRRRESAENTVQKLGNAIVEDFAPKAALTRNKQEVLEEFLAALSKNIPCASMYFDFDPQSERLHLQATRFLDAVHEEQWRAIPFRARPTNRISPFAISINERRSVFVENIQSFFNFLAPQSVDVLSASGTRGFVCSPVVFGNSVIGLIAALDLPNAVPLSSNSSSALELPLRYLAYQLEQHRLNSVLVAQEKALTRFSDPALAQLVAMASSSNQLAVGNVGPALIIIQDLRGSTEASRLEPDPRRLAERFASVYETAAGIAAEYGANFEKSNGDGTVTTLAATETSNGSGLELALRLLDEVEAAAKRVLQIRTTVVCIHRGTPFRGVMGTTRRIAWDICGAEVSDTFSVEKAAKKVPGIVFAISGAVLKLEDHDSRILLERVATHRCHVDGLDGEVLMFDSSAALVLKDAFGKVKQRTAA